MDELMDAFAAVQEPAARPRLVTLEARTGWGKTRVVQAFYSRLAAQQDSRYWPPAITDPAESDERDITEGARKLVFPDPTRVVGRRGVLPEYFWWGLTATRRQAGLLPVNAIVQDLDQFEVHSHALEKRIKRITPWRARVRRWFRLNRRNLTNDVTSGAGGATVDAAVSGIGAAMGLPLGPVGVAAGVLTGTAVARLMRARRGLAAAASVRDARPFGVGHDDLIDPVREALVELARAGMPLVIVVEDAHTADASLVELLVGLLTGPAAPILVVATCWPGLLDEENRAAHRLVADVPLGSRTRKLPESLGDLDGEELADLARQAFADRGVEISSADASRLARHFSNPLAMRLAARAKPLRRMIESGDLDQRIEEFPRHVEGVFEIMWTELPEDVQRGLTLAVLSSAAGVPVLSGKRLLDGASWDPVLIAGAAVATPWLVDTIDRIEEHLGAQPEAYGWARRVDEWLRTWLEPAQQHVAEQRKGILCTDEELKSFYRALADRIELGTLVSEPRRVAAAQLLVTLASAGLIDWDTKVTAACQLVLDQLIGEHDVRSLGRIIELVDAFPAPDAEKPFRMREARSTALGMLGRAGDAAEGFRSLLADQRQSLGDDHRDTLSSRMNLGYWSGAAGDVAGAVKVFAELLVDQERFLGPDHPDTLTTRSNLASWTGEAGDAAGAVHALRELLADRSRILGEDHISTLLTRSKIALWSGRSGDVASAVAGFKRLRADQERVLGPDHPDTLRTRANIASWSGQARDASGAVQDFETLLADQERLLGSDHPDTLRTRHELGRWSGEAGDVARAVEELRALWQDRSRVLGPDDPETFRARNDLAFWTGQAGHAVEALHVFRDLLVDQERVLGPDHPDTLRTRRNVARWLGEAGDAAGAAAMFRAVLRDRTRVLGPDDPATLRTRNALATWSGEAGDVSAAVKGLSELLITQEQLLGSDHRDTLRTRHDLARWRGESGDVAGAVTDFNSVLVSRECVLGRDDPATVRTRQALEFWSGQLGQTGNNSG